MATATTQSVKAQSKRGRAVSKSSASSVPAKPRRANKASTSHTVRQRWGEPLQQRDLDMIEKLVSSPTRTINLKDIPEVTENTFENKSGIHSLGIFRPYKQQIDSDVIAWAKLSGAGYQSRINAALREIMLKEIKVKEAKTC